MLSPEQFKSIPVQEIDTDEFGTLNDPEDPSPKQTVDKVARLADRYRSGQEVDPIQVKDKGPGKHAFGRYQIEDGWHRTNAARLAGLTHISARVNRA